MTMSNHVEDAPRRGSVVLIVVALLAGLGLGAGAMWVVRSGDAQSAAEEHEEEGHEELPPGVVEVAAAAQKNAGMTTVAAERKVVPATI